MSHYADRVALGYLPMRHQGKDHEIDYRTVVYGARIAAKSSVFGTGSDEFGRTRGETKDDDGENSHGDLNCATFWKEQDGKRPIPGWAFAWPAQIESSGEEPDGGSLSTFSAPASGTASKSGVTALPTRNRRFNADDRFEPKPVALPKGFESLPKGYPGLVVAGSEEYSQEDLFLPCGGAGLVAVHHAGNPKLGTKVFDVTEQDELDQVRKSPLQCLTRVHRLKATNANDETFLKAYGQIGQNGLALQIGLAKHPKQDPRLRGALLADQRGGSSTALSALASSGFNPRQNLGSISYQLDGPLKVNPCQKHHHAESEDGDRYGAVHVQTNAFYHLAGDTCAPLEFSGSYPDAGDFEMPAKVYLSYDDRASHPTIFGARRGMWRWWTTVPIYKVTPRTTYITETYETTTPSTTFYTTYTPITEETYTPITETFTPYTEETPPIEETPPPHNGPGCSPTGGGGGRSPGSSNQPGISGDGPDRPPDPPPGKQITGGTEGFGPGLGPRGEGSVVEVDPGISGLNPDGSPSEGNLSPYDPSDPTAKVGGSNEPGFSPTPQSVNIGTGGVDNPHVRMRPNPSLNFYWKPRTTKTRTIPDVRQNAIHLPFLATLNEFAAPAFLFRPDNIHPSMPRYANATGWGPKDAAAIDSSTPVVLRIEAFGNQKSPGFNYVAKGDPCSTTDQKPCVGRYPGGAGKGTALVTAGHKGGTDIAGEDCTSHYGTGDHRFGIHKGVKLGFGSMTVDGGMKGGVDMGLSSSTIFQIRVLNTDGTVGDTAVEINSGTGTMTVFGQTVCTTCSSSSIPGLYGDNHAT